MFALALMGGAFVGQFALFVCFSVARAYSAGRAVHRRNIPSYRLMVVGIIQLLNGELLFVPLDAESVLMYGIVTLFFGPTLHPMFRDG